MKANGPQNRKKINRFVIKGHSLATLVKKVPFHPRRAAYNGTDWGRMIFYVADVDEFWDYLRGKGFNPEKPRDASWSERYFHMPDPDGHELSFARPI
jgi:catechol 2,3-dioxygenase-like lactoylglutathione lyase family enzyme